MHDTAAYCLNTSNTMFEKFNYAPICPNSLCIYNECLHDLAGPAGLRWWFLALLLAGDIMFSLSGTVITGIQKSMRLSARPH